MTTKLKRILRNEWADNMTEQEIANWIEAMLEACCKDDIGDGEFLIRCPYYKPLAIVR